MAAAAGLLTAAPSAQTPSISDVLERAAIYVSAFRSQLAGIVCEETYEQAIVNIGRIDVGGSDGPRTRTLRSDFLMVKPMDADRHVELRDVFEVDGKPIRAREPRVEQLLKRRATDGIAAIIKESARHNIGRVERNINTPAMALMFLDATNQPRFRFKHVVKAAPVFPDQRAAAINDTAVFRVATEMWTVEYEERRKPTIIQAPNGRDRPAKGRFWINPSNGSVLISELIVDSGGVIATVTVSYQSEPLMGFLVPVEMRESYLRYPERITGHAVYGKFRAISP